MKFKPGVITGLQPEITNIFPTLDKIHNDIARRDALVTSAMDGVHGKNSLHSKGLALDLRTKDLPKDVKHKLLAALRNALGNDYDIILEAEGGSNEHIHLEYDP